MQNRDTVSLVMTCAGHSDLYLANSRMVKLGIEIRNTMRIAIYVLYARCFHPLATDPKPLLGRLVEVVRLMVEYRIFTMRIETREYLLDCVIRRMQKYNPNELFPVEVRNHPDFLRWISRTSSHYSDSPDFDYFMILYGGRHHCDRNRLKYTREIDDRLVKYLCIYEKNPSEAFVYIIMSHLYVRYMNARESELVYRVVRNAKPAPSVAIMAAKCDRLNDNVECRYWRLRTYLECVENYPKYENRLDRIIFGRGSSILDDVYRQAKMKLDVQLLNAASGYC